MKPIQSETCNGITKLPPWVQPRFYFWCTSSFTLGITKGITYVQLPFIIWSTQRAPEARLWVYTNAPSDGAEQACQATAYSDGGLQPS